MNRLDTTTQQANRRAAWRWGSFVVGLLSLQVTGGVLAIMLATGDQSVAVVPDYHEKALHWDDEVAARRASAALGWKYEADSFSGQEASGLAIKLTDSQGQPIDSVSGELQLYHHARASQVRRVAIPPGNLGSLRLADCFAADGHWQVSIDVQDRSGNRFVDSREMEIRREVR